MKVRCIDNSIRFRLTKSDLIQLVENRHLEVYLNLSIQARLIFRLSLADGLLGPQVQLDQNVLNIMLPSKNTITWTDSNEVGMEYFLNTMETDQLHLLIEKDFPCKTREDEDRSDTFWELAGEKC